MENSTSKPTEIQVKMDGREILTVSPGGADGAIIGMCEIIKSLLGEAEWRTYRDLDTAAAVVGVLEDRISALRSDKEE